MPTNALLKIYYTLIHSRLLYGLPMWGSTYTSYLYKLITIQNKAVKLIGGGRLLDSPSPFYSKFEILKLPDLYNLEIRKLVHAHFSNKLPFSLSNYFTFTSQVSYRSTRSTQTHKKLLYIPRYSTNRLQRRIKYQGVKIWNDIPLDIPSSSSKLFKTEFKKYLTSLPFKIYGRIIRCSTKINRTIKKNSYTGSLYERSKKFLLID